MRPTFQPHVPESLKDLVLELEQAVLDGRPPEMSALEQLPDQAVFASPILLRSGAVRLMLEGRTKEAQEWLQAAIKGFALQANHIEMLSMIGLLTLLYVRIGDFTETETLLQFLEEETLRSDELCGGFVWWALARGKCWKCVEPVLQSLSADEYFVRAAERFRASGEADLFAYLLLDRWLYDAEGMLQGQWSRRVGDLRKWSGIRPECGAVLRVIGDEPSLRRDLARLPGRYAYIMNALDDAADTLAPPASELRYDVEVQLFTSRASVARKLAAGDMSEAAIALRQLELLQEEMSTPRTQRWVAELKGKVGPMPGFVPLAGYLAPAGEELHDLPDDGRGRLRVQLMSGIRLTRGDGAVVNPKWRRRKSRELFFYLLLQPEYRVLRDQVMEQMFGEGDSSKLANHLYVSLHELRNALGSIGFDDAIEVRGGLIGFREFVIEHVDVEQFTTLSRVGDRLWASDREAAAMLYMDAVRLYGLLGSDMPNLDWLERYRIQLLERQTQMLRRLADYYAGMADDSHTEQWLAAWIELRPDQEEAYQAMIRFWKERGRHAEAVGWYRRLERVCREELGTEPLEETKRLVWEEA